MQRIQAFRYELMPTGDQQRHMRRFAGSCRFVFNKALALQKVNHDAGGKFIGHIAMAKHLTAWRNSLGTAWLKDAPVHPLQHALKDLDKTYKNFFEKRADFPRFKRKGQRDSFRYPDPKQIKLDQANGRLFLPRLGWLRYRNSRKMLGELRNVTVSLSGGKWFVSIQTRREVETPVPHGGAVGIDMGIARFATLSDGSSIAPLHSFQRHKIALRKAQRATSRKTRFSSNWKKAKARVQNIHSRIGNASRDYLHKCSTTISQNQAMVCIEDLQVRKMSRSAAGTTEVPGSNVRAKSGLNKSSSIRAGSSSAASWITSWRGTAAISSPCRRRIPAALARAAATFQRTTGAHRSASPVSNAASRQTPIWSARSMYQGRDTPG